MNSANPFLAAILERPDDDVPRLVLADWLEERGDPRGEFIRLQIQLARERLNSQTDRALRARTTELLSRHEPAWLEPLRREVPGWDRWVRSYQFRRGFIEEVALPLWAFMHMAPALFRHTPIRYVQLLPPQTSRSIIGMGLSALVRALAGCPELSRLACLDLTEAGLELRHLRTLTDSRYLGGLQELRVIAAVSTQSSGRLCASTEDGYVLCPLFSREKTGFRNV